VSHWFKFILAAAAAPSIFCAGINQLR